jgi:hypothetical protein
MNKLQGGVTMNRKYTTQISALLMSAAVTAASCPPAALVRAVDLNETGTAGGYTYNLWNQNGTGDVEFTPDADGKLDLKYSGIEDIMLTKGTRFGSEYKWSRYGKITANYDIDYSITEVKPETEFTASTALFGIYGWTENSRVKTKTDYAPENTRAEYYVVEGWYKWRPPGSGTLLETVEIDGKLYDIYATRTITMGGIMGTDNGWQQFWSIRRDSEITDTSANISGTVTLSEHFKVWEKYGFDPDSDLYDTTVSAEVYRCGGQITMNKGCEVLTEYTNEQLAKTGPAETVVTDPKPEITEPEDTVTPEITDPDKPDPPSAEPEIIPGDADGNGSVNCSDLIAMKKELLYSDSKHDITPFDLNKDRKINIVDFILLKNAVMSDGR